MTLDSPIRRRKSLQEEIKALRRDIQALHGRMPGGRDAGTEDAHADAPRAPLGRMPKGRYSGDEERMPPGTAPNAPAPQADDATVNDGEKLQGTWWLRSVSGRRLGPVDRGLLPDGQVDESLKWIVTGDTITVVSAGRDPEHVSYRLASTQSPKAIVFRTLDGPSAGMDDCALYAFEGDQLRVLYSKHRERPNDWSANVPGNPSR